MQGFIVLASLVFELVGVGKTPPPQSGLKHLSTNEGWRLFYDIAILRLGQRKVVLNLDNT